MTDAIQKSQPSTSASLANLLRDRKDSIAQLVPKHLTPERLMKVAVNCVAKTPSLQACSPTSLLQCVLVAAELGLEPGGALGHMYLVPFKGTCTAIIGYRGLIELARRSGQLKSVRAVVVYAKENFKVVEGLHFDILHERSLSDERGELAHVYAVAELMDGSIQFEVMTRAQVDAVRARSASGQKGPWVTDYEEMAKKTVFRRLAKWLPLSSERWEKALEQENDTIEGELAQVSEADKEVAAAATDMKARIGEKRKMLIQDVSPVEIQAEEANEVSA